MNLPVNSTLIPDGLKLGDEFRLLFVTDGTREAGSSNIGDYNRFVQNQAARTDLVSLVRDYASQFQVVGGTDTVSARNNTNMTGNGGPAIYWVNGDKVADNYGDFYDGNWDSYNWVFQTGEGTSGSNNFVDVYTGSRNDGSIAVNHLGNDQVNSAKLTRSGTAGTVGGSPFMRRGPTRSGNPQRFYAISPVFRVNGTVTLGPGTDTEITEGVRACHHHLFKLTANPPGAAGNVLKFTMKLVDDAWADVLTDQDEVGIERELRNSHNFFSFCTKVDPTTNADATISVEYGKLPPNYMIAPGSPTSVSISVKNDPSETNEDIEDVTFKFANTEFRTSENGSASKQIVTVPIKVGRDARGTVSWQLIEDTATEHTGDVLHPKDNGHRQATDDFQVAGGRVGTQRLTIGRDGIQDEHATNTEGLEILIIDDAMVEKKEYLKIRLFNAIGNANGKLTLPGGVREIVQTVSITDNDQVGLSVAPVNVDEGEAAQFSLILDRELKTGEYAHVGVYTGDDDIPEADRAGEDDYTRIPESKSRRVTWGPGQQTRTFLVPTNDDEIDEADEQFAIHMRTQATSGVSIFPGVDNPSPYKSWTATIKDNDPPPVMSVTSEPVLEGNSGNTNLQFRARLESKSQQSATVDFRIQLDAGSVDGDDFVDKTGTITFKPGELEKILNIQIKGEKIDEPDETLVVRFENPQNLAFAGDTTTFDAAGVILNDDKPLVITVHEPEFLVAEGQPAVIRVEIDQVWTEDVPFTWRTYQYEPPQAEENEDFTNVGPEFESAAIPAGKLSIDLAVETLLDEEEEGIEEFAFNVLRDFDLNNRVNLKLNGPRDSGRLITGIVKIFDGNAVSARDAPIVTEGGEAAFTFELDTAVTSDVVVTWHTEDGSATDGVTTGDATETKDYQPQSAQSATIPAGQTMVSVKVPTVQDSVDEDHETFSIVIDSVTVIGNDSIINGRATATIRDDDPRPELSIANASVAEGGTAKFTVSLSAASERDVAMRWQTADGSGSNAALAEEKDYEARSDQKLTIPAGETTGEIEVRTLDDTKSEPDESFHVLLSHAPNAMLKDDEGVGTITDDDMPSLYINRVLGHQLKSAGGRDTNARVVLAGGRIPESHNGVSGGLAVILEVALSQAAAGDVTFKLKSLPGDQFGLRAATPASDYQEAPAAAITFAAGETRKEVGILVYDDSDVEGDELFRLQVFEATGAKIDTARDTETITIEDDDAINFFVPAGQPAVVSEGGKISIVLERDPRDATALFTDLSAAERRRAIETSYRVCLFGGIANQTAYRERLVPGRADVQGTNGGQSTAGDDVYIVGANKGNMAGNHCGIVSEAAQSSVVNLDFGLTRGRNTVEIQTIQDNVIEGDETVTLQFEIIGGDGTGTRNPDSFRVRHEITIVDDDAHRIRVESASASEGDDVSFNIYVDAMQPAPAQGSTATVKYRTVDGSAKADSDYSSAGATEITLTAPATPTDPWATVSIPTTEDEVSEPEESFTLVLSDPSTGYGLHQGGKDRATGTINDDDQLTVSFKDAVVEEGDKVTVNARLTRAINQDVTVTWRTVSDTAESPADFVAVNSASFTIVRGATTGSVEVTTNDDSDDEPDEDFKVEVVSVTPARVQAGAAGVVAIRDNDEGSISFGAIAAATVEENKAWTADAPELTGEIVGDVTWTKSGADAALFDLTQAGKLSLEAQNFEDPKDADKDNIYEVTVRATDEDGNAFMTDPPVAVTVTNVNTIEIQALQPASGFQEGNSLTFLLKRTGASADSTAGSLKWRTVPDSDGADPAESTDYTEVIEPVTLQLPSGEGANHQFSVTSTADDIDESDETVRVRLSDLTDGTTDDAVFVDSDGSVITSGMVELVGTILDDDATSLVLARTGSGSIAENGGSTDITLTLGRALVAGESVTVPLTVTGGTVTTHFKFGLKGNGGTGVSLATTAPHSAQDPAVTLSGAGAQTATLTLTAVANTDIVRRTLGIAYGTGARAPSSSGLGGGINPTGSASTPIKDDDAMISVAAASAAEGSAVVFTVTLPEAAPAGGVSRSATRRATAAARPMTPATRSRPAPTTRQRRRTPACPSPKTPRPARSASRPPTTPPTRATTTSR